MILQSNKTSLDRTPEQEKNEISFFSLHKKRILEALVTAVAITLFVAFWHVMALRIDLPFILPTPIAAFTRFFELLPTKEFISAVTGSMLNVILGYISGLTVGAIIAFAAFVVPPVRAAVAPFAKLIRSVPVASFILLCILWLTDNAASAFIGFLMVFPIVYENVLVGFNSTDKATLEMSRAYGFGNAKKLMYVYVPSALPYLGSSAMTSLGLAWKACVSAEVLCIAEGTIGYHVFNSKDFFDTEQLFAWTIAVVLMSIALEGIMRIIAYFIKRGVRRIYGK